MTKSSSETQIKAAVVQLAEALLDKGLRLATAESCTGGGIAAALTALPGSSLWFDSGFVTYSNAAKTRMLNVPDTLFGTDGPGAVSEETALAMARGAAANSRAQLSVAVTGIAGPDGGTDEKPVGTVWIAWHGQGHTKARCFHFNGDREQVRLDTQAAALQGLLEALAETA